MFAGRHARPACDPDDHDPSQEGRGRKGVYSCKLEGSAMGTDFYITARSSKFPLDHAHSREEAAALLVRHRDRHPDAIVEPTDTYFERSLAEILASFPLNRITRRFYDAMIGVLPPQYIRGAAGFFLSEIGRAHV